MAAANVPEYQGWVREESESQLTLRRRSTGAEITASLSGISFTGNHQNATGVEDTETPDVLRELLHFTDDVQSAHKAGQKAAAEAIAAAREKRGMTPAKDLPASASQPAAAKPA